MKMKYFLTSWLCLALSVISISVNAQKPCAFDEVHKAAMAKDHEYELTVLRNESQIQEILNQPNEVARLAAGIYEIPVVFHIFHTGGAVGTTYNPSDQKIQDALDFVNQAYAAQGTFSSGTAIPVKFVLAKRSPTCGSTNGIVRVNGSSLANYSTNGVTTNSSSTTYVSNLVIKNLSRWPSSDYYNIWVVNTIDSAEGFAMFPGSSASTDGTMIRVNSINNLTTTLTHELGHAFNFYHAFEGDGDGDTCPANTTCTTQGDRVCDTQPIKRSTASCPAGNNPCTGQAYTTQYNLMDYSSCRNRFTTGQRDRFIVALTTLRAGLISSLGLYSPDSGLPAAACIPTALYPNATFNIGPNQVTLNRLNVVTGGCIEGVYQDKTCAQRDTLYRGSTYTISVRTEAVQQNVRAYIDFNNNQVFDASELILTSNGTAISQVHTTSFTVPATGVLSTALRLRVLSDHFLNANPQPCGVFQYGQAEDYGIVLLSSTASAGAIAPANEVVCNAGNPALINFSVLPFGGIITYKWYYKAGLVAAPTGTSITGWTLITAATASSYDPPTGAIETRTYGCVVSIAGLLGTWASGVRQITVLPVLNRGTLAAGNQTFSGNGDPSAISFSTAPTGASAFNYQWYSKTGLNAAPTGSSITGWTAVSGQTAATSDPAVVSASITYACFVTPAGASSCGTAAWASGCRQITITAAAFSSGAVATSNQTICNAADPSIINFSVVPSGAASFIYQWYWKTGIVAAPSGSSITGWTAITGASASSFDPPSLTSSRTYACFVTPTGLAGLWASGARQITVLPVFSAGTVTNGNQTICTGGNPAPVVMGAAPAGSAGYTYRWYYREGIIASPSGSSVAGWSAVGNGTGTSYDPQSGGTAGRTFAMFVTPTGTPACGIAKWATGSSKIYVQVCTQPDAAQPDAAQPDAAQPDAEIDNIGDAKTESIEIENPVKIATETTKAVLYQNVPNPASETTTIGYYIPTFSEKGRIRLFSVSGAEIMSFGIAGAGLQQITIPTAEIKSGLYLYTMELDGQMVDRKRMAITH